MRRLLLLCLLACSAPLLHAQAPAATASPRDSIFRRARRMVGEGNGVAGRALVDSLLRLEVEGTTAYGDALYWRGALAETAQEAERDYRRVIVEYPLSYYADDALLAIAELEQARGDRAGALQHMLRFVREHPVSAMRSTAALAAAGLAFDQRDTRTGCAMITEARASAAAKDVEQKNKIDYYASRYACSAVDAQAATQVAVTPPRDTVMPPPVVPAPVKITKPVKPPAVKTPVEKKPAGVETPVVESPPVVEKPVAEKPVPAAKPHGIYTIQLAAFNTQAEAERLVAALAKRDVPARVSGTSKPFRVRLDFYPTRAAAAAEVAALKARGIISFVTTEEPPPQAKTP
ncbi:MAG: Sporulation protein [Gemmatimonadetes bacterium]|nr:Sporulation protein [Gemmatimonadota bacterium]